MNIVEITNFLDPALDIYSRLTEAQIMHPQKGDSLFIAESPNVILRALDAGYEPVSLLMECRHVGHQAKEVIERCREIPVYVSSLDVLEQITGFKLTRGVLCAMRRKALLPAAEILKDAKQIAVLYNVMNPTNVGAIFRSAAALGMDAVLLCGGCSDPLYRRACRVSMGTVFQIPWTITEDLKVITDFGFKTVALALKDCSLDIGQLPKDKLALLLGAEGEGLPQKIIDDCDYTVKIPMYHGVDSLNVAAASAVAFYALRNRKE